MPQSILLIDDSPTIREILKVYLMAHRFEFLEADEGERGLRLARLLPVSLVIADFKMKGMDGLSFTRALRQDENLRVRATPVILLTGDKEEGLEARCLQAGASGFLTKPVSSGRLNELLRSLLPKDPA